MLGLCFCVRSLFLCWVFVFVLGFYFCVGFFVFVLGLSFCVRSLFLC